MARKGRKTRWRKLPIPIGSNQGEASCAPNNVPNMEPEHPSSPSPKEQVSRVTFNEDEYTKITTPRQDMLFKKGYLSKKRPQPQEPQQPSYTSPVPSHSPSESMESEQYVGCDEAGPFPPPFVYPSGYMDPNGLFYLNGGSYEVFDPYTNSVTLIVGPGSGYPGQQVLAAVPCHPVPVQPLEWFAPPHHHQPTNFKKRNSTDSQHWGSSQSCESPSSGQELEAQDSSLFYPQSQYIYPGYMFGAPLYNINGVSVQGAAPPPPQHQPPHPQHHQHASSQHQLPSQHLPQPADQPKRRKKRRKRRRPGMGDDGSESSCEEVAGSGVSSDAGQGSSCSKTTDSGIHTGADSPQPQSSPVPVHNSPPPEVSTEEEEPSQLSISHIPPCLDPSTRTDSSTEDETNQHPHDTSLQSLIEQTENITISPAVVNDGQDSESDEKEEQLPMSEELPKSDVKVIEKECPIVNEVAQEEMVQEEELATLKDDSDEWLIAKDEDPEEESNCIVEEVPKEFCFSSECSVDSPVFKEESILLEFKDDIEECIAEETGYSEEGWGSAEETSVEERWAMAELGEEVTVDKPITEAVTRWLESQGTKALVSPQRPIESEDEGIGEETSSPTGSKNVKGNPFLVRYPSTGTRVANKSSCESESCAWRSKCDPLVSVDRYYRLGAESPPLAASFKTATAHPAMMHIDPSVPFPCGLVCCILQ